MDLYKILNIHRSATLAEVKSAYLSLAKKYHPDLHPTNKEIAESKFKAISNAYETLGDLNKRKEYDLKIGNRHSTWNPVGRSAMRNRPGRPPPQYIYPKSSTVEGDRSKFSVDFAGNSYYDIPTWNAWHYGDNAIPVDAVRQTGRSTEKDSAAEVNKHQAYYARRNAREEKAAWEKLQKEHLEQQSDTCDPVSNLNKKRMERQRKGENRQNSSTSCSIS